MKPKPNNNPITTTTSATAAKPLLLLFLFTTVYLLTTTGPTLIISSFTPYHFLFLSLSSNSSASSHLRHLTRLPHLSSSDADSRAASYVLSSFPFPSHFTSYSVLLSFPLHRPLSLLSPASPPLHFSLTQLPSPSDPSSDVFSLIVPTFHAYVRSDSVTAPLTCAYYGRVEAFDMLCSLGIDALEPLCWPGMGRFTGVILLKMRKMPGLLEYWFTVIMRIMQRERLSLMARGCQRLGFRWVHFQGPR